MEHKCNAALSSLAIVVMAGSTILQLLITTLVCYLVLCLCGLEILNSGENIYIYF